jgi:hypothetical protein
MGKTDVRKKPRANHLGAQWWRKLSLPRRGKKETLLSPVDASVPKTQAIINRIAKRRSRLRKAVEAPRVSRAKHLALADWDAERGMARVVCARGNALSSMGVFGAGGVQWLYPEEAVYLVDRAQMDLRVNGVPASLHRAFGLVVEGRHGMSLNEYCAFTHLRRAGYVVRRHGLDFIDEEALEQAERGDAESGKKAKREKKRDRGKKRGRAEVRGEDDAVGDGETKRCVAFGDDAPAADCVPEPGGGIGRLADGETGGGVRPSFSVWRVGGFKRRGTHRPLFHLLVWRYEDAPPQHEQIARVLATCTGKTRLRAALIDRGVVVCVDMANNATPLSARYTCRLPTPLDAPLASGPVPLLCQAAGEPNAGSAGGTDVNLAGDGARPAENVAHPVVSPSLVEAAAAPAVVIDSSSVDEVAADEFVNLVMVVGNGEEQGAKDAKAALPTPPAAVVELTLVAARAIGRSCSVDELAAWMRVHSASGVLQEDVETIYSREEVLAALRELARRDSVVLSSGTLPTVYVVHDL